MPEKDNYNGHEGHRERLRNRLSVTEDDDIISHEMLEAMLFFVLPRVNTNPIAHRLLDGFGSVEKVLNASEAQLQDVEGIGKKTAKDIRKVIESKYLYFEKEIKEKKLL